MGPLHDPLTWYGINYAETQVTQWDFQNKGTRTSPAWLSFILEVPLCNLHPSIIYSIPCDRIVQRAYSIWKQWTKSLSVGCATANSYWLIDLLIYWYYWFADLLIMYFIDLCTVYNKSFIFMYLCMYVFMKLFLKSIREREGHCSTVVML